jgi:hypothetical protein
LAGWVAAEGGRIQNEDDSMTQLLEKAYSEASRLPEREQDAIASAVLDMIGDEEQWSRQFAASQNALAKLAEEALAEHRAGKTLPLDPATL